MKYSYLEGIPSPLSALTYGTPWTATRESTQAEAFKSYDMAWDAGFRTFDTAHSYGLGEDTLGAWLASRKHRQEAVILDKGCNPGQKGSEDVFCGKTVREQAEESLRRLRTDHLDLYILHRDDPPMPVDEIVDELNRLKKEGKILRFGGSNWTLDRVCRPMNTLRSMDWKASPQSVRPTPWRSISAIPGAAAFPSRVSSGRRTGNGCRRSRSLFSVILPSAGVTCPGNSVRIAAVRSRNA